MVKALPPARPMFTVPDRPFAAYIFDCDGTLADSMPLHYRSWLHAFEELRAPFHFDEDLFYSQGGMGFAQVVDVLNRMHGTRLDAREAARLKEAWMAEHLHHVEPIEPVLAFAREAARTHPVAVASGSPREPLFETLRAIGAKDLFPVVVSRDDVEHGKPAPDTFLLAAERLGVKPADCCVFEDTELGLTAAHAAGMTGVLVESRRRQSA